MFAKLSDRALHSMVYILGAALAQRSRNKILALFIKRLYFCTFIYLVTNLILSIPGTFQFSYLLPVGQFDFTIIAEHSK